MLRFTTSLALAAAATLAVSAPAMAKTEITFWHAMGGALGETVDAMAREFNEIQDEIALTPVYKGSYEETMTAAIAAFRAGEQPHIVQIFDAGAATIINAQGATFPVADLLDQYGVAFNEGDYIPGVRYFYADADGRMIGMPFNSSTPVLYYNKAALAAAGVEPPRTWEEFEAIAPAIVEAGYAPLAQSHLPWIFSENFHSRHNLQLSDAANGFDGVATAVNYNNDGMITHFTKLKDWQDKGWFAYYGTGWGDNQAGFEKQEVAMWLGSSASFGGLRQKVEFDFGTSFLPYWAALTDGEEFGTFIGGAALFAMSGKSDDEYEAVAQFFQYLASAEAQLFWHKETGYVPITFAAYGLAHAEGYYDEEPRAEVGIRQLTKTSAEWNRGYRLGFYVQIREVMNREYDKIFSDQATVEDAFATIETDANALLDRFKRTVQ